MILPFYGSLSDIPSGWKLCDGSNGTPDLRNRFIVGAGSSYGLGNIGGEASHRLTISEMPSHNHLFAGDDEIANAFNLPVIVVVGNYDWTSVKNVPDPNGWYETTSTGGSQAHNNLPPYIAMYWIMKVS
jgi:microcystin-dependent protein